jgi:hypothetical protein
MRTYRCVCGNSLFYDNSLCIACERTAGFCPACSNLVTLVSNASGQLQCGNPDCGASLVKCFNYSEYEVCNRCVVASSSPKKPGFCDCCRFNQTIPDLAIPGNMQKWYRLEAAKRRLFYDLSQLGLPYGTAADGIEPALAFDFKADALPRNGMWRTVASTEQVYTGHEAGLITINIREADDVEREKLRVDMGESKRTLIGHFRHEIGHFYWDVLVKNRREDAFKALFGDHNNPSYADALEAHYKNGPPADWEELYVSAYASMHPWEDFAETWAVYLSMVSALDTANYVGFGGESDPVQAELAPTIARYQQLGIALNEMNRSMGLLDLVPEVFVPPVCKKLHFIHELVHQGRLENRALQLPSEAELSTV